MAEKLPKASQHGGCRWLLDSNMLCHDDHVTAIEQIFLEKKIIGSSINVMVCQIIGNSTVCSTVVRV